MNQNDSGIHAEDFDEEREFPSEHWWWTVAKEIVEPYRNMALDRLEKQGIDISKKTD